MPKVNFWQKFSFCELISENCEWKTLSKDKSFVNSLMDAAGWKICLSRKRKNLIKFWNKLRKKDWNLSLMCVVET